MLVQLNDQRCYAGTAYRVNDIVYVDAFPKREAVKFGPYTTEQAIDLVQRINEASYEYH